jgi:hypothetical protein
LAYIKMIAIDTRIRKLPKFFNIVIKLLFFGLIIQS